MNGRELERMFALIDANADISRDEVLAYVKDHREEILRQLEVSGEADIPIPGGEKITVTVPHRAA